MSFAKEIHVYVVGTTEVEDMIVVSLYPSQRKNELFYVNLLQLSVFCELPLCRATILVAFSVTRVSARSRLSSFSRASSRECVCQQV